MSPEVTGAVIAGALAVVAAAVGSTIAFVAGRSRAEHEIRFSQIYQKQAEVLAHMNGLLVDVEQSVTRLTNLMEFAGEPTKKELLQRSGENLNELSSYFNRNSVWLDDDLSKKMDAALDEIWKAIREFSYIFNALALSGTEGDRTEAQKRARDEGWADAYKELFGAESVSQGWLELDKRVKARMPELRNELRAAFREIIGTVDPPARLYIHPRQTGW